ncbi:MAG: trigger factor [Lachnospiraceae bacterium]|nr:trigger factor [Lachnospiraceae bacterium]
MSRKFFSKIGLLLIIGTMACQKTSTNVTMQLGGVDYPEIFVKSGYYFDKASMSDALLTSMLEKVTSVEKPSNMGTVELPDFSQITLTNNKVEEIDSAKIEAELEKERDTETTYSPIKTRREAKMTDKVIIDFKGYVGGEELEGGSGDDFELVLGSGQFIPGFEEKVAGHFAGRKFSFNINFPENYDPSLAGKEARFEVTIKSIEEAMTPEIDEEFVKKHTKENSVTVDEYKEEVKRRIETRNKFLNNQNLIYQLTDYLFENTKFNPTEEALAWQFSVMMDEYNRQATQSGTTFSAMISSSGASIRDAYEEIKSAVPQAVQSSMLIDELIKKFPSNVTEDDIKKWFANLADAMGYGNNLNYEDYKSFMGYDNLKTAVEQENALLKAANSCNIVDYKEETDK